MRFLVLAEFFGGVEVLDDFFFGFAISNNTPMSPSFFAFYKQKSQPFYHIFY